MVKFTHYALSFRYQNVTAVDKGTNNTHVNLQTFDGHNQEVSEKGPEIDNCTPASETPRPKSNVLYSVNQVPPWQLCLFLGFQVWKLFH